MKVIVIEDTVYKVPEKTFQKLVAKEAEIKSRGYQPSNDVDMDDFITSIKGEFREVGRIHFHFQL